MREFKPGDKVRILPHTSTSVGGVWYHHINESAGVVGTLKKVGGLSSRPAAWTIDIGTPHPPYVLPEWIELVEVTPTSITTDVNDLIDQVALGKIQRGGKQAQYTVYRDGDDVVIKLFGVAK